MLHHIATISVCYGGHFESKMTAKIPQSSDLAKFGFQVYYDVANWYPNFTGMLSTMSMQTAFGIIKMAAIAMETIKNLKNLKVLGVG